MYRYSLDNCHILVAFIFGLVTAQFSIMRLRFISPTVCFQVLIYYYDVMYMYLYEISLLFSGFSSHGRSYMSYGGLLQC